jgi:hypothetical protein
MMTKQQLAEAILALPDDATVRDAIEELELIEWLERRIAEADANPNGWVSDEAARHRFARWLS